MPGLFQKLVKGLGLPRADGRTGQSSSPASSPPAACPTRPLPQVPWPGTPNAASARTTPCLVNVPVLQLFPGPRGLAEEGEAGLDGGIKLETTRGNAVRKAIPPMPVGHGAHDGLQRDPVKRIVGMMPGAWVHDGEALFQSQALAASGGGAAGAGGH